MSIPPGFFALGVILLGARACLPAGRQAFPSYDFIVIETSALKIPKNTSEFGYIYMLL